MTTAHHSSAQGATSAASASGSAPKATRAAASELPSQGAGRNQDSAQKKGQYALTAADQKSGEDASTTKDTSSKKPLDDDSSEGKALAKGLDSMDQATSQVEPAPAATSTADSDQPADQYSEQTSDVLDADLTGLKAQYADAALQQAANRLGQLRANGWKTEGRTKVSGTPTVASTIVDGEKALHVTVCTDPSDVKVVDAQGRTVQEPSHEKSRILYTLARRDGQWKIIDQGFPADPTC